MGRGAARPIRGRIFYYIAAWVVIAAGFCWRLSYILRISPFIDEFTTILAAQMIVRKGVPLLPSGLFYDIGLLFSYVVAAWIGLSGFHEVIVRFPSLILSLLSVAITFRLGRRFFSPAVALMASTLVALSPEAVLWGGRARPYAQFQFWGLVGIWALAEGFTSRWRGRWRAMFWLAMTAAALSHLAAVVLMASAGMAALPAYYLWAKPRRSRMTLRRGLLSLWPDGLLAALLVGGMVLLTAAGRPTWIKPIEGPVSPTEGLSLSALLSVDWLDALRLVEPVLLRLYELPWTVFLLVNLCILIYRAFFRQLRHADAIPLYLQGLWLAFVAALTIASPWHIPRYIAPLIPILFLLGSHELMHAVKVFFPRNLAFMERPWWAVLIIGSIGVLMWTPLQRVVTEQEYGYDLAFRYVLSRWQEGDAVAAFNGSGCCVYLGHCDYYLAQISPWLLDTPGGPVERYSGAQWIESVAQLDAALNRSSRVWYVIDEERFSVRVSREMQEAIRARFHPVFVERGVWVFLHER